jgi:hypothetical protein
MSNSIILKDFLKVFEEYVAAGTITPGMVVEYTSAGKVQAHSSAGQNVIPMIATEDELQGNDIDDDYSADDQVFCWIPQRGAQALLIVNNGEDISKGDLLESAGNGKVQKYTADVETDSASDVLTVYPKQIIGEALEAVDMSGSSAADPSGRIKVRIY